MVVFKRDLWVGIQLGVGTLLLFLGYFAHCFIAESVIYSRFVNYGDVEEFGGYYGQALQMFSFALMNLFAPAAVSVLSAKKSLQFTGVCFGLFFLCFIWFNKWCYYIGQVICGFGYAVFNVAEGVYIAEHTNEASLEWVTSVETAVSHSGQLFAGFVLAMVQVFKIVFPSATDATGYSGIETTVIYALFLVAVAGAVAAFQIMPAKAEAHSIVGKNSAEYRGIWREMKSIASVMLTPEIVAVFPLSCYQGFFTIFFLSVYPTSFNFNMDATHKNHYVWVYCYMIGFGVVIGGVFLAIGSQFREKFTIHVSMILHWFIIMVTCGLVSLTTPQWAFVKPHQKITGLATVSIIAFLVGIGDCCVTTFRSVVCQKLLPEKRMEVFSLTRIIQAVASGVALIWSPHLTTNEWMAILSVALTVAMISTVVILRLLKPDDPEKARRLSMEDGSSCPFDHPSCVVDNPVFMGSPRRLGVASPPIVSLPSVKSSSRLNTFLDVRRVRHCHCDGRTEFCRPRSRSEPDGFMEVSSNPVSVSLSSYRRIDPDIPNEPIYVNFPFSAV